MQIDTSPTEASEIEMGDFKTQYQCNKGRTRLAVAALCGCFTLAVMSPPALSDPPPWAPAHGYHAKKKAKGKYKGKRYRVRQKVYRMPPALLGGYCRSHLFDEATIGALLGAAAGGYTGSQFGKGRGKLAATAIGTLVGAVIGHEVGDRISRSEEVCFSQAFEHAPDRETITWSNRQQGAQYQVTPTKTVRTEGGAYCREYTAQAVVGGKVVDTYGRACRQADGSWKLVN